MIEIDTEEGPRMAFPGTYVVVWDARWQTHSVKSLSEIHRIRHYTARYSVLAYNMTQDEAVEVWEEFRTAFAAF